MIGHLTKRLPRWGEIPPPCWLPRELGTVCTRARPGTDASISLLIENADVAARTFTVETGGADGGATVTPASVDLAPYERATVTVTVALPSARLGTERELLVWVRGCQAHVLRWKLKTASHPSGYRAPVRVRDRPEFVHHWYDHFYCEHPCSH